MKKPTRWVEMTVAGVNDEGTVMSCWEGIVITIYEPLLVHAGETVLVEVDRENSPRRVAVIAWEDPA